MSTIYLSINWVQKCCHCPVFGWKTQIWKIAATRKYNRGSQWFTVRQKLLSSTIEKSCSSRAIVYIMKPQIVEAAKSTLANFLLLLNTAAIRKTSPKGFFAVGIELAASEANAVKTPSWRCWFLTWLRRFALQISHFPHHEKAFTGFFENTYCLLQRRQSSATHSMPCLLSHTRKGRSFKEIGSAWFAHPNRSTGNPSKHDYAFFFLMILVWSCNFQYHPDIYLSYNYRTTLIKRSCLCCYMEWDTQFVTSHTNRVHFFFFFLASTIIKDKNLNILFLASPVTRSHGCLCRNEWRRLRDGPDQTLCDNRTEVSWAYASSFSISSPSISSQEIGGWVDGEGGDLPFLLRERRTTQQNSGGGRRDRGAVPAEGSSISSGSSADSVPPVVWGSSAPRGAKSRWGG